MDIVISIENNRPIWNDQNFKDRGRKGREKGRDEYTQANISISNLWRTDQ